MDTDAINGFVTGAKTFYMVGASAINPISLTWGESVGIMLRNSSNGDYLTFRSKDNPDNLPYIEITYTPASPPSSYNPIGKLVYARQGDGRTFTIPYTAPAGCLPSENFTNMPLAPTVSTTGVYATDLNADGYSDILVANSGINTIAWYENNGDETFELHNVTTTFDGARSVFATDLNADSRPDILATANVADDLVWYENNGDETFSLHNVTTTFDSAWSVFSTDLNADGRPDILATAYEADDLVWYENNGDETFSLHNVTTTFDKVKGVFATDLNNDTTVDIIGGGDNITSGLQWWKQECI
jgi:hypothetical protein